MMRQELAIPEQTATGKESSNPLKADSLPKTIVPTKLVNGNQFTMSKWQELAIPEQTANR